MSYHPSRKPPDKGSSSGAGVIPSPSPSPAQADTSPKSTSWFSDDEDNADSNDNSTLASSPPPLPSNPTSSHKKGKGPAVYASTTPSTPSRGPRRTSSALEKTTWPQQPRTARSSELLSARIATYEARSANASINVTARCGGGAGARSEAGAALSVNKATKSPSDHVSSLSHCPQIPSKTIPTAQPSSSDNAPSRTHETQRTRPSVITTLPFQSQENWNKKARRSSSVLSSLSTFADYYDAATKRFPSLLELDDKKEPEAGNSQQQQVHASPPPGPRRTRWGVLTEWEERVLQDRANEHAIDDDDSSDDEDDEEWEKRMEEQIASTGVPPLSHFQVGRGGDGFKDFIGGGQSSSSSQQRPRRVHQERIDLSEQERSEEASLYWEDAMADLEEAMKKLAPNERNPRFARINHDFSRSMLPERGQHSESTVFSERKPGREEVLQIFLDSYPKHKVNEIFFEQTERLNEEAKRRTTCIDDPNADPTPLPTCVQSEQLELTLRERLSKMLSSPRIFTPEPDRFTFGTWNFRPGKNSLRAIEIASAAPDLELKDESLRARAVEYSKNKEVVERALKEDRILGGAPDVDHARKCSRCHNMKVSGCTCRSSADIDALQSLILEQHELRQDLERLEATKRGIQTSFSTLHSLPIRHRLGNARQRQAYADQVEQERLGRRTGAPDETVEDWFNTATADSEIEECSSLGQTRSSRPATRGSSSVYSDRAPRLNRHASTPHAVLEEPKIPDGGVVPNLPYSAQDRAAAYRIMQNIQTYHDSGRTSRVSEGSGPANGESFRGGRDRERRRRGNFVVTSPSTHDEERYPKRQNIVQQ